MLQSCSWYHLALCSCSCSCQFCRRYRIGKCEVMTRLNALRCSKPWRHRHSALDAFSSQTTNAVRVHSSRYTYESRNCTSIMRAASSRKASPPSPQTTSIVASAFSAPARHELMHAGRADKSYKIGVSSSRAVGRWNAVL